MNMSLIAKNLRTTMVKHSPEILTGMGIAGMIGTTILAVKATPKALKLCEELKNEREEVPTKVDYVKKCWKCYIPTALSGAMSAACIVGSNSISARRNAALAVAYALSDTALQEYQEKVLESVGEKKEKAIRDKVAEEQIKKNPVGNNEVYITEKGNSLCYEPISGRYFRSDMDKIMKAENILNGRILDSVTGYVTLNEFYDELGLPSVEIGYDLGWNVDERLKLAISATVAEDGTPCLVIGHYHKPKYNYC